MLVLLAKECEKYCNQGPKSAVAWLWYRVRSDFLFFCFTEEICWHADLLNTNKNVMHILFKYIWRIRTIDTIKLNNMILDNQN